MRLTTSELNTLNESGLLILPNRFSVQEVDLINAELANIYKELHPGNIVEKASGEIRTSMGLHQRSRLFSRLVRHPRLLEPATQILEKAFYIQQTKVNNKAAFSGELWQWHYDFATHHNEDGVARPEALNLHIFLDDVNEFNGPLYFIPGSHIAAQPDAHLDTTTTSYPLWVVDQPSVSQLIETNGLVSAKGSKGTMLIFKDSIVHASSTNISPWSRSIFSLIVNPIDNAATKRTRAEYKHHSDFTPITSLPDDCLFS